MTSRSHVLRLLSSSIHGIRSTSRHPVIFCPRLRFSSVQNWTSQRLHTITPLKMASALAHAVECSDPAGTHLVAKCLVKLGQTVIHEKGNIKASPDVHTIQISADSHMDCPGNIRFTNHSCDPNCVMNVSEDGCWLVAIRDIMEGQPVTFDYNTTEWSMNAPFECRCGSPHCRGLIQGFSHLDGKTRSSINPEHLSSYVRSMAAKSA